MLKRAHFLVVPALCLICVAPALATDQDTFNKLIAKYAPNGVNMPLKLKSACACFDLPQPQAGFIVALFGTGPSPFLKCDVPLTFGADGSLQTFTVCENFAVLGK